jgi:hypothetical protein
VRLALDKRNGPSRGWSDWGRHSAPDSNRRESVRWSTKFRGQVLVPITARSGREADMESPMKCLLCEDTGRVCENHPDQPWEGPHACARGGAGAPCPRCNAATGDEPPCLPNGFKPDGE